MVLTCNLTCYSQRPDVEMNLKVSKLSEDKTKFEISDFKNHPSSSKAKYLIFGACDACPNRDCNLCKNSDLRKFKISDLEKSDATFYTTKDVNSLRIHIEGDNERALGATTIDELDRPNKKPYKVNIYSDKKTIKN